MALSQVQVIQSLAEALSWFEKELSWEVAPAELNHLTGRIGELYAAMITRGQMALETNQRGYDVISNDNERISVKTITSSNHVTFNEKTFGLVDRVMVLRVNIDDENGVSVEIILDCPQVQFLKDHTPSSGKYTYGISGRSNKKQSLDHLQIVKQVTFQEYSIFQYDNGTIIVKLGDVVQSPTLPLLREFSDVMSVDTHNGNGGVKNTRQLGADIIRKLNYSNRSHAVPPQEFSQNISAEIDAQKKRGGTMSNARITHQAEYKNYKIRRYDSGTIEVLKDGVVQSQALPVLRRLAPFVTVDINNGAGNAKNTRTLGLDIIQKIKSVNI